jgi:hypothetical protein
VSSNGARLFFPAHVRAATQPAWSGELTPEIYQSLTDSPARRELAKRILNGDSAVWVIVESGKKEADDAMVKLFTSRLRFLETATGLPPIDPTDPDSKLGPGPELRVQLSLLRVKRNDSKENIFLSMLAGPQGLSGFSANEPFVAVVFGRGRVLGAWPQEKVSEEFIEEATRFLIGSCSCEVKNQNPGWDLLMRLDWDAELKKADLIRAAHHEKNEVSPAVPPAKLETVIFTPKESLTNESAHVAPQNSPATAIPPAQSFGRQKLLFLGAGAFALFIRKLW